MASISCVQTYGSNKNAGFFGYANGNYSYGYYNVTFNYSGISHNGGTLSISGANVNLKNPNSGYTTNTVYINSVTVNGTNIGLSASAKGNTSYHSFSTPSKDVSVSCGASATSCSVAVNCSRTGGGSQTLYGTLTFSAGSLWNDINAWNPAGDAQNGLIFDLRTSDGSSWSNLTNEPSGFTKTYGTTATISNIRTNITGAHYTTNNVTNTGASSFSWTFNTADWACNLYSAWNTYTIAYNANGGSGAPGSQTKTYGTNLTLSSTRPTRTGYTFLGWSTNSGATSASYSAGATLSSDLSTTNGATVTLYAVWSINSYYLDLNGWLDGASSGGLSPHGTANVTVNSSVVGSNVADYYAQHTYGSTYSISNIKANSGYQYNGVHSGSLSGTIGAGNVSVVLDFSTTKPSNLNINGSVNGPFEIGLSWSATGLNITNYTVYANGTQIYSGTNTSFTYGCAEETTYNIYFTATNAGGTTTSNTISLTTPADQAKIRIKDNGVWKKGKTYYKKDGRWVKAKKIYIKVNGQWEINNNYDN